MIVCYLDLVLILFLIPGRLYIGYRLSYRHIEELTAKTLIH